MGKAKARRSQRHAVASPPGLSSELLLEQALTLHRHGQLPQAGAVYRQILAHDSGHLDALQLLGALEMQLGRHEAAVDLLRRAVAKAPEAAGLHCNLGLALHELGRHAEALDALDRALALRPGFVEALNNKGNVLRRLGRLEEALSCLERVVGLRPDFPEALYNLGCTLMDLQRPGEALDCLSRCLRLNPDQFGAHLQSGIALLELGRPQEALVCCERHLRSVPDDAEAHFYRGNALLELRRPEEAVACYRRALIARNDIAEIHYNLGNALVEIERHEDALAAYEQALKARPGYVEAQYNRAGILQELGRHQEAAAAFEALMALAPEHRFTVGKLLHSRKFCCDWNAYEDRVADILEALRSDRAKDAPFSFLALSHDAAAQLRCARIYADNWYPTAKSPLWTGERYRHDRIRVAYVSADLREHPVAYLLAGVLEAHDRTRFETIAISFGPRQDSAMGRRVAAAFDQFHEVSRMRDAQTAALMRDLEVDIAVDLMGYTQNNRTGIFAMRPAPIQVNYLGFPGSMGASYMDYIIADPFVIPEEAHAHYSEQVVWMPHCFQANDDQRQIAPVRPSRSEAGLPEDGLVFCAFNNVYKFNPTLFDVWMRLLRAVPGSVLWLATDAACVRENLANEARRRGVNPDRLVYSPRLPYAEHLARFGLADLFLDTLPFNAGTTASDALWAGVPVLTCSGEAFAARMAGSLLKAVGLPELITHSLEEYEALALKLASSPSLLSGLRDRLARNRTAAPLFDTPRFCRHLETAYGMMWQRHLRGEPPGALRVPQQDGIAS